MLLQKKNFELRKNDRDFRVGDTLVLKEWNPETKCPTGQQLHYTISYIVKANDIPSNWGLLKDFCILGLVPHSRAEQTSTYETKQLKKDTAFLEEKIYDFWLLLESTTRERDTLRAELEQWKLGATHLINKTN